jgi:hypothetical protein
MSIHTEGPDADLADRLNRLLIETAESFLRAIPQDPRHTGGAVAFEISLAVRRRRLPA